MSMAVGVGALILAVTASVTASVTVAVAGSVGSSDQPGVMASGTGELAARPGGERLAAASVWTWPLDPRPEVLRAFDPPDPPWLPGHRGVDLRADVGQPIRSPAAGVVSFSGQIAGRGVVVVRHSGGLRSTFEPVTGAARAGTPVTAGDRIGLVSDTPGHCRPLTCLHWGVVRAGTYLDPLSFLGRGPIVLLPLD